MSSTNKDGFHCRLQFQPHYKYLMVFALVSLQVGSDCLRMTEVRVPQHVVRYKPARLECQYDLEGESLYSVKWYKDGNEFYRYQPRDNPPALVFEQTGIDVNVENSTESQVVLEDVPLAASGRYRCEVSGEAPSFQTVSDHGDMTVVALPVEGPRISGGKSRYQPGEWAYLNCTSAHSKPSARLTWFINGEQANISDLVGPDYEELENDGLTTTILGLKLKIKPKHFKKGDMKLKCLAKIATVYWRTNEESVEGDRMQKGSALESRNAVAASSDSRADRVQASGPATRTKINWMSIILGLIVIAFYTLSTER